MSTTYYVRKHGTSEATEHPTDKDATAHAGVMAVLQGGVWLVIRKTGRLSTIIRRRCADVPYPEVTDGGATAAP